MPALVERERREAVCARRAPVVEVVLLRRARAVQDHDARLRLRGRREQRVRQPVVRAEPGRFGCLVDNRAHGGDHAIPGLSARLPPERGGPARGGRLRRDRAREGVRHAGVRLRRGRHARPRARVPAGVRLAHRALRGHLREQGVPVHRRLPAVRRGGALVRRRERGRAASGARRRLRPSADLHAREQQDRGGARLRRRARRRHDRARLVRRDRAAAADRARGSA